MKKNHIKSFILKTLLIVCIVGITSTSISIGKSYIFKSEIKSFYSLPLGEGREHSIDVLKAKIKSLERINLIKDDLYLQIFKVTEISLIVSCISFN